MSINNVVIVGRLTRDAELRYTPSNQAVATFTLAVDRNFKNQNGEREADFINCVMWRKSAENLASWVKKGGLIGIVGRIQTRNYENTQGQRVYVTEVVAESFQMLESRAARENQERQNYQQYHGTYEEQMGGTSSNPSTPDSPFGDTSSPMDISDDDLPF